MAEAKIVLITGRRGASAGRWRSVLRGTGMDIVVNYQSSTDAARALCQEITGLGRRAVAVPADVGEAAAAARLVVKAMDAFGRLDYVVNNAGVGEVIALDKLDEAEFIRTLQANLLSAFMVSQAAVPHMTEHGGRLVFLSSGAARTGGGVSAAYAASKAVVEGLMHAYATTLRPHRITANAIAPSLVESDMVRNMKLPPPEQLPMGRLGRPMKCGRRSE